MGGEKKSSRCCTSIGLGSPPHRRGKVRPSSKTATPTRITPAWAGKRLLLLEFLLLYRDHPRMGGEKALWAPARVSWKGSPPRGRGKVPGYLRPRLSVGITPAWAGKSVRSSGFATRCRDHPRVGGEKRKNPRGCDVRQGSPPRGRGKAHLWIIHQIFIRITPAWAGKSLFCFTAAVPIQDHPRMGGEKLLSCILYALSIGSPPHGRGKVSFTV